MEVVCNYFSFFDNAPKMKKASAREKEFLRRLGFEVHAWLFQPVGDLLKALWQPGKDQPEAKSDAASWDLNMMTHRPLSEIGHFRTSWLRNRFKSATLKEVATDWRRIRRL